MLRYVMSFIALFLFAANAVSVPALTAKQLVFEGEVRQHLASWIRVHNKSLSTDNSYKIVDTVYYHSMENNLDPLFIMSMIKAESGYKPQATSGAGAKGLMQVLPRWHHDKLKGRNPYAINVNIEVGTKIWDDCLEKGHGNVHRALRCYSGGAGASYGKKIAVTHKTLAEKVKVIAILNDQKETMAYRFDKPRVLAKNNDYHKSADPILAFYQASRN